jgi:hypothetical protein
MTRTTYIIIALAVLGVVLAGIAITRPHANDTAYPAPTGTQEQATVPTLTATQGNVSFSYPEKLPTSYMHEVDWPPKVAVTSAAFACEEGETEIGRTHAFDAGGQTYCVTTRSEGAAGSMYTDYTYSTIKDAKLVTLTFTLRSTQCGNYDEPNRTECEQERAAFDVDALATNMLESVAVK